jgi:hypothetical protein
MNRGDLPATDTWVARVGCTLFFSADRTPE